MIILNEILFTSYRFKKLRNLVLFLVKKLDGGEFHSSTLRKIFKEYPESVAQNMPSGLRKKRLVICHLATSR